MREAFQAFLISLSDLQHSLDQRVQTSLWRLQNPASPSPVLISDLVACADAEICRKVCGNPSGCSDIAYPKLVLELLPTGKELGAGAGAGTDGCSTPQSKGV